jgi:[ribosomal protein S5]-alanine N-acetyltransferase
MPVTLLQLELPQLGALRADPTRLDAVPVVTGALPPRFILDAAVAALKGGKPPLWFSPFLFVEGISPRAVGSGGFKGAPSNGRVEIGYGVAGECRGRGIATEAIARLARVAFRQPDVVEVFAETAMDNGPSQRVVQKAGFRHTGQRDAGRDGVVDQWLLVR